MKFGDDLLLQNIGKNSKIGTKWAENKYMLKVNIRNKRKKCGIYFYCISVFFHEHSRFTGQQGKGDAISLSPLYHFRPFHRHIDIGWAITAERSPLHIASNQT